MDNSFKIIGFLGRKMNQGFTMRQLSRLLNIPYATFHREIRQLADLLIVQEVGHSKIVRLNGSPILHSYLSIASDKERKEFLENQPIIRKIAGELGGKETVLLFGSYASGRQAERSDIDVMVINQDGKRTLSFSKYELLFKKKINPIFLSEKEFRLMLSQKTDNVAKQALANHVVLRNPQRLWEMVMDAV